MTNHLKTGVNISPETSCKSNTGLRHNWQCQHSRGTLEQIVKPVILRWATRMGQIKKKRRTLNVSGKPN
jgi:hypothetical protein